MTEWTELSGCLRNSAELGDLGYKTRRFSDSLMARIFACHARDPSSILGLRDFFAALSLLFFNSLIS